MTLEFAERTLSAVSVSPATVAAIAVSVCVPVAVGVQEKVRFCDPPGASVTECAELMVEARLLARLVLNVALWLP